MFTNRITTTGVICRPLLNRTPLLRLKRFNSTTTSIKSTDSAKNESSTSSTTSTDSTTVTTPFDKYPIYLISIPITTEKTYVHCKYTSKALPDGQESYETKAVKWASKQWGKLENSEVKVNKQIVNWINKLLVTIPWTESCLRSIPSQDKITRLLKDSNSNSSSSSKKVDGETVVPLETIKSSKLGSKDLKSIPIFYPSQLTTPQTVLKQISNYLLPLQAYHKKWLITDLIGIPLTLPFAALPVVPNVPCFYLCFRSYCHFSALKGLEHLKYLMGLMGKDSSTNHLDFLQLGSIEEIYLNSLDGDVRSNIVEFVKGRGKADDEKLVGGVDKVEKMLISEDVIEELCRAFGIEEMKQGLKFAMMQEKKRLEDAASASVSKKQEDSTTKKD
ncbi:unnamed protein product [Ambrosiozyma monospora]|uniref:Unnamed protein product n=1 Tax=Ambrosiozyma monospora TaxID=43982 RepID=A0A9W7DH11_AMBMO|nr:unnamed protein product [Ambrosiozyma monospora]